MKLILPLVMLLLGLGGGAAGGLVLRPPPAEAADPTNSDAEMAGEPGAPHRASSGDHASAPAAHAPRPEGLETVRLPNQFVVPLIHEGRVQALVVIGLALELHPEHGFELSEREPRLRALFLQVLFDYANAGGFDGVFTAGEALLSLRRMLREAALLEIGPSVYDVLITELLRQENG